MKIISGILILVFILIAASVVSVPGNQVFAFDSDNVTSVDVVFSDNLSAEITGNITLQTVTIEGLPDAISDSETDAMAQLRDMLDDLIAIGLQVIFLVLFASLSFWRRDLLSCFPTGFAFLIFGFQMWPTSHYLSIILVIWGATFFARPWVKVK